MKANMPGRCARCCLRELHCVCASIRMASTSLQFVVLRHVGETYKSTNSVRWAALALAHCQIIAYSGRTSEGLETVARLDPQHTVLLYPDEGTARAASPPARTSRPDTIVVLDGTWRQVRRMHNQLAVLHRLPKLSLSKPSEGLAPLRHALRLHHRSTLQAMADAVATLDSEATAEPLRALHALTVEATHRSRGTWPLTEGGEG